jgi:hypothetical protein
VNFFTNRPALILAGLYIAFAFWVVRDSRAPSLGVLPPLPGLGPFLITFPISAPLEALLRIRLDHRFNLHMAFAISSTALLLYSLICFIQRLFSR